MKSPPQLPDELWQRMHHASPPLFPLFVLKLPLDLDLLDFASKDQTFYGIAANTMTRMDYLLLAMLRACRKPTRPRSMHKRGRTRVRPCSLMVLALAPQAS